MSMNILKVTLLSYHRPQACPTRIQSSQFHVSNLEGNRSYAQEQYISPRHKTVQWVYRYRENLLISGDRLKLADLGSCRGVYTKQPYTEYISTRWYRSPECLMTDGYYGYKMDIWGAGCVMFEITSLFPLFPGNDELDQIYKIHNVIGTPNKEILERFQRYATHMELIFDYQKGTGIKHLIPYASPECIEAISK